jgi:LysR family hydrogen peroxide-inducible transcriptional activator
MVVTPLPFTLRQLQYLLALAETRNFHRAAELCSVVQPSLSSQVAAMEAALGVRVFERGRGGVRVTQAGEAVLEQARLVLREAESLTREAARFKDPLSGPLRLGLIPTVASYFLPRLVPQLRAAFPKLQPQWTEERTSVLVRALQEGRMDGAILAQEADLEDLELAPLGRDPFLLALPRNHRLAKKRGPVAMAELEGERILLLDEGHCLRTQAIAACRDAKVEELGYRATSLPTLLQMVAGGAGITLVPELAAATESARADVVTRPFRKPAPFRTLVLAWHRGSRLAPTLVRIAEAAAFA